jgi:hypothetical protein
MMQRILITGTIFFFFVLNVFAQYSVAPRLGLNLNTEPFSEIYGYSYLNSFNGGVQGRYQLNKWFSIKTEINYNTKKKTYQYQTKQSLLKSFSNNLGGLIDTSLISTIQPFLNDTIYSYHKGSDVLRFIELPVMATVNYKQFELSSGFYLGYLLKAFNKDELTQKSALLDMVLPAVDSIRFIGPLISGIINSSYPGYKSPYITESSNKSAYRAFDYGFIAELTYHSTDRLFFSFRYARGFQNYRVTALRSNDVYNTFTFSLGYTFGTPVGTQKPKGIYDLDKIPTSNP